MINDVILTAEVGTSTIASGAIATSVNAQPLLTALITFGVSLVTLAGGELVKYLVAYLKKKTQDLNVKEDEEAESEEDKKGDERKDK